jgi:hypothetical protein
MDPVTQPGQTQQPSTLRWWLEAAPKVNLISSREPGAHITAFMNRPDRGGDAVRC